MTRKSSVKRATNETNIEIELTLEGSGNTTAETGVAFFDHMLTHVGKHGLFDLTVKARGDVEVDAHHTVEDVGILLGQAISEALGDRAGIVRYGEAITPMDEALSLVAVDLSGRPYLSYEAELGFETIGNFETELVVEFLQALTNNAGMNLHVKMLAGKNVHHIIESIFKGLGRALDRATMIDERRGGMVPSTKGSL